MVLVVRSGVFHFGLVFGMMTFFLVLPRACGVIRFLSRCPGVFYPVGGTGWSLRHPYIFFPVAPFSFDEPLFRRLGFFLP